MPHTHSAAALHSHWKKKRDGTMQLNQSSGTKHQTGGVHA
jgi:hypothetical protein